MTRDQNTVKLSGVDYVRVGGLVFGAVCSVVAMAWHFTQDIKTKSAVMQSEIQLLQSEVKRLSDRLDRVIERR